MFENGYNRAMRCAGLLPLRTKEAKSRAQELFEAGDLSDNAVARLLRDGFVAAPEDKAWGPGYKYWKDPYRTDPWHDTMFTPELYRQRRGGRSKMREGKGGPLAANAYDTKYVPHNIERANAEGYNMVGPAEILPGGPRRAVEKRYAAQEARLKAESQRRMEQRRPTLTMRESVVDEIPEVTYADETPTLTMRESVVDDIPGEPTMRESVVDDIPDLDAPSFADATPEASNALRNMLLLGGAGTGAYYGLQPADTMGNTVRKALNQLPPVNLPLESRLQNLMAYEGTN